VAEQLYRAGTIIRNEPYHKKAVAFKGSAARDHRKRGHRA